MTFVELTTVLSIFMGRYKIEERVISTEMKDVTSLNRFELQNRYRDDVSLLY
jgi:hypothetical protein